MRTHVLPLFGMACVAAGLTVWRVVQAEPPRAEAHVVQPQPGKKTRPPRKSKPL